MDDLAGRAPGDDLERLADLAGDEVDDLAGRLDQVEVAAARVGHGLQDVLVEVGPDGEGRGGHAPRAAARRRGA